MPVEGSGFQPRLSSLDLPQLDAIIVLLFITKILRILGARHDKSSALVHGGSGLMCYHRRGCSIGYSAMSSGMESFSLFSSIFGRSSIQLTSRLR
jgi:hypothetical protein